MYIELTPQDTVRDLQKMLISAIPSFEYPRVNLDDYEIKTLRVMENEVTPEDFILGVFWNELDGDADPDAPPMVLIEQSSFAAELSSEEINILAFIMIENWLQRQITSIENTRMKYSGSDFKMTSQANHLAKLITLKTECRRQTHHFQRLYKRREKNPDTGIYRSTWYKFGENSAIK